MEAKHMNQNLPIIVMVIIACAVIFAIIRSRKKQETTDHALLEGRFTTGHIVSVQRQTSFDRDRGNSDFKVMLEYREPTTGEVRLTRHEIDPKTPNLPLSITGARAGRMNLSALRRRTAEMKAYSSSLEAQGGSIDEVKEAMMERALEHAKADTGGLGAEADENGYHPLNEPAAVDVYLHVQAPMRNGIHLVFRK